MDALGARLRSHSRALFDWIDETAPLCITCLKRILCGPRVTWNKWSTFLITQIYFILLLEQFNRRYKIYEPIVKIMTTRESVSAVCQSRSFTAGFPLILLYPCHFTNGIWFEMRESWCHSMNVANDFVNETWENPAPILKCWMLRRLWEMDINIRLQKNVLFILFKRGICLLMTKTSYRLIGYL